MMQKQAIQLFEQKKVRTVWDTDKEKWWFSIVDVVSVLTCSDYQTARKYGFAWVMAFIVWQVGRLFAGGMNIVGLVIALVMLALLLWQLFKPYKEAQKLTVK